MSEFQDERLVMYRAYSEGYAAGTADGIRFVANRLGLATDKSEDPAETLARITIHWATGSPDHADESVLYPAQAQPVLSARPGPYLEDEIP